jgi:hypothetical protein
VRWTECESKETGRKRTERIGNLGKQSLEMPETGKTGERGGGIEVSTENMNNAQKFLRKKLCCLYWQSISLRVKTASIGTVE